MMMMMMMMMTMMMMMMMTVIDGEDNDGNNGDCRRWRRGSNIAMEHAFISLVLVIDIEKDFEQAYTVGHRKTCVSRPILLSSTKILFRVQVFGNLVIFVIIHLKHLMPTAKSQAYIV